MPVIQRKGAQSSQGFGEFAQAGASTATYIEDVFSTYVYNGTGAIQSISDGLNFSVNGGLVWTKRRDSSGYGHYFIDTVRGATKSIDSTSTSGQATYADSLTAFGASGYTLGADAANGGFNNGGALYASWGFRKQAKFFDIVTYTGTGANRTIAHNLGSAPGCIIVKRTDITGNWQVYHSGLTSAANSIQFNLNSAQSAATTVWNSTAPTSSVFSVGTDASVNASGGTYVAYLFASNASGFGASGADNVITCGSYAGNGSATGPSIALGYEPQWILVKRSTGLADWYLYDSMRSFSLTSGYNLLPNSSAAENTLFYLAPNATGFSPVSSNNSVNGSTSTYIYIAIRRGPMKTPTSGTSVFNPYSTSGTSGSVTTGFAVDMQMFNAANTSGAGTTINGVTVDRLRGANSPGIVYGTPYLLTTDTYGETSSNVTQDWNNTGYSVPPYVGNGDPQYRFWSFGRAPGFFDEVCYAGNGNGSTITQNVNHNLGVTPELVIIKAREGYASKQWTVYSSALGTSQYLTLPGNDPAQTQTDLWNGAPTSTLLKLGTDANGWVNASTLHYVAYLFATCPGVSKVGSYSGTGSTQTINCGFAGGARFVLIKRSNSPNNSWYVWDTARGMVSGNDWQLTINQNYSEVNNNDVYTTTGGFQLVSGNANVNISGGTYIYLAIA